eukprot:3104285-Prymnesium_polylepis.1
MAAPAAYASCSTRRHSAAKSNAASAWRVRVVRERGALAYAAPSSGSKTSVYLGSLAAVCRSTASIEPASA